MLNRLASVVCALLVTSCATGVVDPQKEDPPGTPQDPEPTSCTTTKTVILPSDSQTIFGGQCLPEAPLTTNQGPSCVAVDGRKANGACTCDATRGRVAIEPRFADIEATVRASQQAEDAGWDCFCEIVSLQGPANEACQTDEDAGGPAGFCYVDPTTTPPIGNPSLAKVCPDDEQHLLRFTGLAAEPVDDAGGNEGLVMVCDIACE